MLLRSPHPFLWIGVGTVAGLLLARAGTGGLVGVGVLSGGCILVWWKGWSDRGVWGLGLFAVLGWLRGQWEAISHPHALTHLTGKAGHIYGYLLEEPFRTARAVRLLVQVSGFRFSQDSMIYPASGKLLLYTRDTTALHLLPGEKLWFPLRVDSVKFGQAYWHSQGVYVSGFTPIWQALGTEKSYLMGYFYRWRLQLIQALRERFAGSSSARALIEALLLGYKRGLDPETRTAFQLSGTAHILAVSGLHVGLVLTFALFLVGRLLPPGTERQPYVTLPLIGVLAFYGFLTAASPSAMRAVIMGSIALVARMLYHPYAALNAMGFAAFLQLLISPNLIYHLGFQLSYAAVAGILAWYGPCRHLLGFIQRLPRVGSYVRDLIAVSIAAQAGTFGLSWAYFGQFPLYFLVANLVAIPLATALSYAGVLWLLSLKVPLLGEALGWVTALLAEALTGAVSLLAALPGSSLALPPTPAALGITLSAVTILAGFIYQASRPVRKVEVLV